MLDSFMFTEDGFIRTLDGALERSGKSDLLVFVHGYNVPFEEAACRTAQLTYDLGFEGPASMFVWPSLGKKSGYARDRQVATDHSPVFFADYLTLVSERTKAKRIHVIAHSMGNEVLCRGLEILGKRFASGAGPEVRVTNVVMAAPDVWTDTFTTRFAKPMLGCADHVTLYASSKDLALFLSENVHAGEPRLGSTTREILILARIDTVVADEFANGILNHSYYADVQSVIHDLIALIRLGWRPVQSCLTRTPAAGNQCYWVCTRAAPSDCLRQLLDAVAASFQPSD
jgi:esterase/lipase superfamily enzyme